MDNKESGKKITAAEKKRLEALDRKIERITAKISENRRIYDELMDELQELIFERYPEKKEEYIRDQLYQAYMKSHRPLEQIVAYMESSSEEEE